MAGVDSASQVVPEDLSRALILSDVKNTIVTSRMRKGDQLEDLQYSWPIEQMGARESQDGVPEGKDVDSFEDDRQKRIYNRAQRFWRKPKVTVEAEKVLRNVDLTKGKYNKQVTKKVKEQKRDIEKRLLSDSDSYEGDGVKGYQTMGMGRVINDGTLAFGDVLTTIPTAFRTPAAQIYTGTLDAFDEDALRTMLQTRAENLGATTEFTLFAGTSLKSHISTTFGNYRKEKEGYAVVVRTQTTTIDRRKFLASIIDVYEGEFGIFDVELAFFLPNSYRGYGVDMDQIQLRPLMYCDHSELENQGGGRRGLIDSILGWEFGDPRGHFKIAPSDEASGVDTTQGS